MLTGDYLVTDWRPDLIQRMLEDLHPRNLRFSSTWNCFPLFISPHSYIDRVTVLSKNTKYLETKVEAHYGTEYHIDRVSEELLQQWQVCFPPPGLGQASTLPPPVHHPPECRHPARPLPASSKPSHIVSAQAGAARGAKVRLLAPLAPPFPQVMSPSARVICVLGQDPDQELVHA